MVLYYVLTSRHECQPPPRSGYSLTDRGFFLGTARRRHRDYRGFFLFQIMLILRP